MSAVFVIITISLTISFSLAGASLLSFFADRAEARHNRKLNTLLEHTRTRSFNIIHKAMQEAHEMLVSAELTGIKQVASGKTATTRMEKRYERDMANLLSYATGTFVAATEELQQEYREFLTAMKGEIEKQIKTNSSLLDDTFRLSASRVDASLTDFLDSQKRRISQTVEEELKQSKALLDSYRNERIKVINEQLATVIEQIMAEVLHKKLSLSEEVDFIEEALGNAKRDGFFTK